MTGTEIEPEAQRIREHRAEAEEAASALETALEVAGLPPLPGLSPAYTSGVPGGPYVALGGCNARVVRALADALTEYARLTGRLVDGESQGLITAIFKELGVSPALPSDGLYLVRRELTA